MKNSNKDIYNILITVLEGVDRGKKFTLNPGGEYSLGRSAECDIRLDQSDKTISRKHALIKVEAKSILIENLSSTNPVQVKGKPVSKARIGSGKQFQVGNSLFVLEVPGRDKISGRNSNKKLIILSGLLVLCTFMIFIGLSGKKEQPDGSSPLTRPAEVEETSPPVVYERLESLPVPEEIEVSSENQLRSDQHFRQGMFFYDTGNTLRAVNEWEQALSVNPNNADARAWFLRAEREIEDQARKHYQNAMLHYKYMRYTQAEHEFRMVLQLSRNKSSDQYINSLRYLNELQSR
ncbi:FHA domain-containing protein [Desulfonatronovibrio magnus]|uniref:FHA domain-containing protein n=1 Tax=Desulfonatronovibrio magnus TaxID=698827 RepID=UPI0005EB381A|nr:FHA domain-containing protein [Desulfonatronovibrio magnus]